jgi:hypothetical protein
MIFKNNKIIIGKEVNKLAKNYNTLDYSVKLQSLLKSIFPLKNFDSFSKYELHEILNETLMNYYNGEEILKYKLFEQYIDKKNLVAAFEIKVNNSRVDFLTINGRSTSFEIKSELDNLSKLRKQMSDYMLAFEYNYLIIDEKHLNKSKELLPDSYGLWCYKNGKYSRLKTAKKNDKIDPKIQLELLTKREIKDGFPKFDGLLNCILKFYNADYINSKFKFILKERYKERWGFLSNNKSEIFPIDIQFFFNTNIEPELIYYH